MCGFTTHVHGTTIRVLACFRGPFTASPMFCNGAQLHRVVGCPLYLSQASTLFNVLNTFRDTVLLILSVSLLDGVVECLFFNVTITLKGDGDDDNDTRINPLLQYGGHQEPSSIDPSLQNNTRVVVLWPCNVHATWAISPPCHYHWWYWETTKCCLVVLLSRIVKTCVIVKNCQDLCELSRIVKTPIHQSPGNDTTLYCDWWLGLCLTILVDKYGCKDIKDWPTSKTRHQRVQRKRDNHRADRSCFLPLWFLICHPTIFDGNGIKWCLMNKVLTYVSTFDDVSIFDGSNNINPMGKSQVLELS